MKYTKETLHQAVNASLSIAGVLRHLGLAPTGGSHAHISRRVKKLGIDTSHFNGRHHRRAKPAVNRLSSQEVLVLGNAGAARTKPHVLRRALKESGMQYACAACGLAGIWNAQSLTLHVDHINGKYFDNRIENLRFLCPNCHSQTATWAGRNRFGVPVKGAFTTTPYPSGRTSTA